MNKTTHGIVAVSLAAGVGESTLRSWFDRGLIPIGSERASIGRGTPREIDFNAVLQIGIAAELVRLGMSAGRACRLALSFSDSGNEDRNPGELFSDDKTLLVVFPKIEAGRVIRERELSVLIDRMQGTSFTVVDISDVYRTIANELGVPLPIAARN